MREELDKKLVEDFPDIFRDRYEPMSKTSMCHGFPGDGWYNSIRKICIEMHRITKKTGIHFVATQVKEKFGLLRFYFSDDGRLLTLSKNARKRYIKYMWRFTSIVENETENICENCGDFGCLRTHRPWIRVLCDKCNEKRNKGIL